MNFVNCFFLGLSIGIFFGFMLTLWKRATSIALIVLLGISVVANLLAGKSGPAGQTTLLGMHSSAQFFWWLVGIGLGDSCGKFWAKEFKNDSASLDKTE